MSTLLEAVRQIRRDLIDKRLWPIAVALLVALVAVPVVIGAGGDAPAPGAVALDEPGPAAATPPAADASTGRKTPRREKAAKGGRIDDPFFDPPKPPSAGTAAGATSTGGATRAVAASPNGEAAPRASGPATPAKRSGTAAKEPPAPATATATKPPARRAASGRTATAPARASYLRTVVRINGAGGGKAHPISRLTPLGGTSDPGALFLGIAEAGARYAVFVLGPRATSRGEATCKGATDCRMIGLKAGQTQVVTVRPARGGVQRFTLRVESIRTVRASADRARSARAHVHPAGRRVQRIMRRDAASAAALGTARYDRHAGVLRAVRRDVVKNASE